MTRLLTLAPLLLGLAGACTQSTRLQVLQPSIVTSPPDIHRIAVIDRSRAKNVGQGILGTLEGLVTGEGINADNEGRSRAMTAVVTGLRESPRFDAVETFVPRKELESSLFDKELSWDTAVRICREADCQGIVSLEAFDSDSQTRVDTQVEKDTDDSGNERNRTVFVARRETRVVSGWRYYDVVGKGIIDDVRTFDRSNTWTHRGNTRDQALSDLPAQNWTVSEVGALIGASYARRIAPTYVWVTRSWYSRGSDALKRARDHVRAMDWAGAATIWEQAHETSPESKVRGRAAFNLAVDAERLGDLEGATAWATEAAVLLGNSRARSYRRTLEVRRAEQLRLQEQMRTSAPGRVGEDAAGPLAKPAKRSAPDRRQPEGPDRSGGRR